MESFKQYWNAVWHFETPTDPSVQWFYGTFGDFPIKVALIVCAMSGFLLYMLYRDYVQTRKP